MTLLDIRVSSRDAQLRLRSDVITLYAKEDGCRVRGDERLVGGNVDARAAIAA